MNTPRYDRAIAIGCTISLGSITAWAIGTGSEASVVVLSGVATLFFLGLAVPAVSDRVPRYQRVAMVALGSVAVGLLALGHRSELAIALTLLGAASGIDLAVRQFRASAR